MKYELKSMAYSVEMIKNMMAQNHETSSLNYDSETINLSSEIIWPITNSDELDKVETLLNNQKIKNNQV